MHTVRPIRKRMKRRETPGVRPITFSCHRRLPLLGNPAIRDTFLESLAAARARFRFELFAWVVMPEHVHLLVRPHPGAPLDRPLLSMKMSVAERVITRWRDLRAPILDRIAL